MKMAMQLRTKHWKNSSGIQTELLTNHNQLRSQDDFDEIRYNFHKAYKKRDLESIFDIYLNEMIDN